MRTTKKSTMMKWRSMGSRMMIRALILSFHWIKTWEMTVSNRCAAPTRPMVSWALRVVDRWLVHNTTKWRGSPRMGKRQAKWRIRDATSRRSRNPKAIERHQKPKSSPRSTTATCRSYRLSRRKTEPSSSRKTRTTSNWTKEKRNKGSSISKLSHQAIHQRKTPKVSHTNPKGLIKCLRMTSRRRRPMVKCKTSPWRCRGSRMKIAGKNCLSFCPKWRMRLKTKVLRIWTSKMEMAKQLMTNFWDLLTYKMVRMSWIERQITNRLCKRFMPGTLRIIWGIGMAEPKSCWTLAKKEASKYKSEILWNPTSRRTQKKMRKRRLSAWDSIRVQSKMALASKISLKTHLLWRILRRKRDCKKRSNELLSTRQRNIRMETPVRLNGLEKTTAMQHRREQPRKMRLQRKLTCHTKVKAKLSTETKRKRQTRLKKWAISGKKVKVLRSRIKAEKTVQAKAKPLVTGANRPHLEMRLSMGLRMRLKRRI